MAAGAALVILAAVAAMGSRTETLRRLVISTLADRLDGDVELQAFSVDLFPSVTVRGEGLVVRLRGHGHEPPLITLQSFVIRGGLLGLSSRPRKFRDMTLQGLEINVPPGGPDFEQHYGQGEGPAVEERPSSPIHIERLEAHDAVLRLIPRRAGKEPREFLIARLRLQGVGTEQRMPFMAELTNPLPRGAITSHGRFGPWNREVPALTPLQGTYLFENVDLSTVDGIAGQLHSTGSFRGVLGRIEVTGETRTPDFRLDVAGNALPLTTRFDAVVDGTDGDTYLRKVTAQLRRTAVEASGAIAGTPGRKGRTVRLHVKVTDGRIEDLLSLSIRGAEPLMTGGVALHTDFTLPPGKGDVLARMRLAGEFDVFSARFRNRRVEEKLGEMSARATGADDAPGRVASDLEGRFTLANGSLALSALRFGIPGATVNLDGTYGLRTGALHFDGTLRMQATISEAAGGGVKSVFLKLVDPFFRRRGAGAVIPIKVRGTRDEPKFGVDLGKALTPR